jgi:hypothetical protein
MSIVQQRSGLIISPMRPAIVLSCRVTVVLSSSFHDITALGVQRIHGGSISPALALATSRSVSLEISV